MVRREVCNWKWGIVVIVSWVWKVFAGVVADIDVGSLETSWALNVMHRLCWYWTVLYRRWWIFIF